MIIYVVLYTFPSKSADMRRFRIRHITSESPKKERKGALAELRRAKPFLDPSGDSDEEIAREIRDLKGGKGIILLESENKGMTVFNASLSYGRRERIVPSDDDGNLEHFDLDGKRLKDKRDWEGLIGYGDPSMTAVIEAGYMHTTFFGMRREVQYAAALVDALKGLATSELIEFIPDVALMCYDGFVIDISRILETSGFRLALRYSAIESPNYTDIYVWQRSFEGK